TAKDGDQVVPHHLMIVSGDVKADDARVFGHTNNRCGDEFVKFDATQAWFYRIDAPWDGKWVSNDAGKRFRLEVAGADVTWVERREADGTVFSRAATMEVQADGSIMLKRKNDD